MAFPCQANTVKILKCKTMVPIKSNYLNFVGPMVFQTKVINFDQIQRFAYLIEQYFTTCFGLFEWKSTITKMCLGTNSNGHYRNLKHRSGSIQESDDHVGHNASISPIPVDSSLRLRMLTVDVQGCTLCIVDVSRRAGNLWVNVTGSLPLLRHDAVIQGVNPPRLVAMKCQMASETSVERPLFTLKSSVKQAYRFANQSRHPNHRTGPIHQERTQAREMTSAWARLSSANHSKEFTNKFGLE